MSTANQKNRTDREDVGGNKVWLGGEQKLYKTIEDLSELREMVGCVD